MQALLKRQLSLSPELQQYYTFLDGAWKLFPPISTNAPHRPPNSDSFQTMHLITWNIDFMAECPQERMSSAISHLESLVSTIPASSPVVIFLQEMQQRARQNFATTFKESIGASSYSKCANDLTQLSQASWIRERFSMSDLTPANWAASYGTVTLVDHRLTIVQVSRLKFISEYGRDALLVDIAFPGTEKVLRLCNVHLDSMDGSMRPIQWKGVAQWLQRKDDGVAASILAGDCNANRPRDKTEPQENGFRDAYLELGGVEDVEEGATWGFQCPSSARWGPTRLDKVVFWGNLEVKELERIGVGIRVEDEDAKKELGEWDFVTDHYGLVAKFELPGTLENTIRKYTH
ncbi:uncharacterized protein BDR25DRAFT_318795 [Lindgomyces ingoldianus]|uniref:Uncharacterized protein n=1 Tax=Lindgomyces ingoldianus TaxID=673940 RepID=A0ACB6QEQ9_9PLEO|nr:uncharacterized protein BDR25DRAFT_318795 [Lindgomyces ingoldianus]KAF2465098.1 hypothetical protein BDR25DRAFT_318795 [Lindgomyces ingoldianus]